MLRFMLLVDSLLGPFVFASLPRRHMQCCRDVGKRRDLTGRRFYSFIRIGGVP